jgi:leukotriene-A4 hydrolase
MSAVCVNQNDNAADKTSTFYYRLNVPIPSYLLAIVIGNLESKTIDSRTSVITEPTNIDDYAHILRDLGTLLNKTEDYVKYPYIWGNYTILVLPPSFPVGGMENPLLTFASPTIMVPDGSQIYVATHEIAHSWTGNLVTCRDWSNLWLNEGFTTFIERRVSAQVDGQEFSSVESLLGNQSYYDDMNGFGQQDSYSSLYPFVKHNAPDGASSLVTYEKGQQFMYYLMYQMDSEGDFQEFLGYYLKKYAYQSITFLEARLAFNEFVIQKYGATKGKAIIDKVDWVAWVQTPGPIPANSGINFTTPSSVAFQDLGDAYISLGGNASPPNIDIYINETKDVNLKVVFHSLLLTRVNEMTYKIA